MSCEVHGMRNRHPSQVVGKLQQREGKATFKHETSYVCYNSSWICEEKRTGQRKRWKGNGDNAKINRSNDNHQAGYCFGGLPEGLWQAEGSAQRQSSTCLCFEKGVARKEFLYS
eukprot:c34681_g1_i1 orf=23-364(-)